MKTLRLLVMLVAMLAIGIVAGRTYQIRANPGSADWIDDAPLDGITIDELTCDHEPLPSVLDRLSKKSGVGIVLDTKTFEQNDLRSDVPISVNMRHVPLSDALA